MIFPDGKVLGDELGEHPAGELIVFTRVVMLIQLPVLRCVNIIQLISAGILEFSSAGIGEVRIRAVNANLYLAMNQFGSLYGEVNSN